MPRGEPRYALTDETFNSLFEMPAVAWATAESGGYAFNSLFEMPHRRGASPLARSSTFQFSI